MNPEGTGWKILRDEENTSIVLKGKGDTENHVQWKEAASGRTEEGLIDLTLDQFSPGCQESRKVKNWGKYTFVAEWCQGDQRDVIFGSVGDSDSDSEVKALWCCCLLMVLGQ